VNDRVKKGDQWVDETTFVDVTLWGRTAEVANEYLSKGSNILIEGRLKLDSWEKDGQKRSKLRIVAEKMQMLGSKGGGEGGGSRGGARPAAAGGRRPAPSADQGDSYDDYSSAPAGFPDDEIPF
jgi:single-strand DNA-binding protein